MDNRYESRLGSFYRQVYEALCGKHPNPLPWHYQWLATFYLSRTLKQYLPKVKGRVLDVGCGEKPYQDMFSQSTDYIGIDITEGGADIVVDPNLAWPLESESFDAIFASQVMEHVENLPHTLGEIVRVTKPGAVVVFSFPFLYNEHGAPYDFQRFTTHGAARLLPYEIDVLDRQGGFGSTVIIMVLNWVNESLNHNKITRLLKAAILPVWLPFCFLLNMLGLLLDSIDVTNKYYNNVFLIFRKSK